MIIGYVGYIQVSIVNKEMLAYSVTLMLATHMKYIYKSKHNGAINKPSFKQQICVDTK